MPWVDPEPVRKWWLNKTWPKESMNLSDKISKVARMDEIKTIISNNLRDVDKWQSTAKTLVNEGLTTGTLPKNFRDLETLARRVFQGDTTAFNDYKKSLNKAINYVGDLEAQAEAGIRPTNLQKAYNNIIKAVETGSEDALNSAIENAVTKKATYNAERIARTEFTKAYNQGQLQEAKLDGDVIGIRYELSSAHPEPDECNDLCETDAFGLGAGCYPLSNLPDYPFHVGCLCNESFVYQGEVVPDDEKIRDLMEVTDFASIDDRIEIDEITAEETN